MTENPYQYNSPVGYAERFAGRQAAFSFIQANLVGGHQHHALVILGPDKMGKTSLLRALPSQLDARYVPVRISLRAATVAGEKNWLTALAETLPQALEAVDIQSARLPGLPGHPADLREALQGEYLTQGLRALRRDRHLLVLVDNAERLLTAVQNHSLPRDTFRFLAGLLEQHPHLDIVMAVDSRYEPDLLSVGKPFDQALIYQLRTLLPDEMESLLTSSLPDVMHYDAAALKAIYDLTAGHPYLTQMLGSQLFERSEARRHDGPITVSDVEAVVEPALARSGEVLGAVWKHGTTQEQLILTALCALSPEEPPVAVPYEDIGAWLIAADRQLDPRTINATWRRLEYEDVLTLSADGKLMINGGLQRRWLHEHVTLPGAGGSGMSWRRIALIVAAAVLVLAIVITALSMLPEANGGTVNEESNVTITLDLDLQATSDAYDATQTATAN